MILTITLTALSLSHYITILFVALFAKINTKTVKLARALSLPVTGLFILAMLCVSGWMLTRDFIHRGLNAFKN